MKYDRLRGATSNMVRVFVPDNSKTNGGGLTGLTNASTNLTIAYLRELDSAPTTYTGANIEAQTTIGTFQAPSSSSKVRFKEVNATSFPGVYELQFHDSATIFGTADASRNVQINIYEATTTALKIGPNIAEIRLIAWDMQTALSATTIGTVTTLTNAPSDSAGVTTLLTRIIGTLLAGNHSPQSGDAYARLGAAGAGLTALGDTRIANLDATVSSRLASGSYTAPDNATIGTINTNVNALAVVAAAIKAKTDQLLFSASGYVRSILMRWLTDDGAGTPNALSSGNVPTDAVVIGDVTLAAAQPNYAPATTQQAQDIQDAVDLLVPGAPIEQVIEIGQTNVSIGS